MAKKTFILDDYKSNKKKNYGSVIFSKLGMSIILGVIVLAVAIFGIISWLDYNNSYMASVNGIRITKDDFENAYQTVLADFKTKAEEDGIDVEDGVELQKYLSEIGESGVSRRLEIKREALNEAVKVAVQLTIAEEKGITVSKEDRIKMLKNIEYNLESQLEQYNQYLGTSYKTGREFVEGYYKMTYAEYKQAEIDNDIIRRLITDTKMNMVNTAEELKTFYEKDPDKYDLFVVDSIFVSYLTTEEDVDEDGDKYDKTVLLEEGKDKYKEELANRKAIIDKIEKELTENKDKESKEKRTFEQIVTGIAAKESDAKAYNDKLKKTDGKISFSGIEINEKYTFETIGTDKVTIDEWLNEELKNDLNPDRWIKINVYGASSGDLKGFEKDVVGVYFVKYSSLIDYDTQENEDADGIRKTVKNELLEEKYDKQINDWLAEPRFAPVLHTDFYKDYLVVDYKTDPAE